MASPSPSPSPPPQSTTTTPHLLALPAPSSQPQSSPTLSTTSSSPKLPPPHPPFSLISPPKKNQPLPWTHQETVNLIQTYQEKWYSLKRGQLKASQWEEVSITVAARCGFDEPSKTSTQCRHKMEKLRKRYRAERIKAYPNSWQYFQLMDNMERGPFPLVAVAQPVSAVKMQQPMQPQVRQLSNSSNFNRNDDEFDSDDNDFRHGVDVRKNKSKSINNILRGGTGAGYGGNSYIDNGIGVGSSGGSSIYGSGSIYGSSGGGSSIYGSNSRRIPVVGGNQRGMMPKVERESSMLNSKKRMGRYEDSDEEDDDEDQDVDVDGEGDDDMGVGDGGKELALEIRGFAERFMRVEKMKIEMMRETERYRMEMEKRRMEMILNSQRKIVDTIGRAFRAHKKLNTGEEI